MTLTRGRDDARRRTWRRVDGEWVDEVSVTRQAGGWTVAGDIDSAGGSEWFAPPFHGHYRVETEADWRTRRASLDLTLASGPVRFDLRHDGHGIWSDKDGHVITEVCECLDIDLYVTPATNTLAIRRLALGVGQSAGMVAALVAPDDTTGVWSIQPSQQVYERVTQSLYRFTSFDDAGVVDFTCDLDVDSDGLIRSYGEHWRTSDDH